MVVEMGESLIYSWLRHEKNCQVVQNNWKVSNKDDTKYYRRDDLEELLVNIRNHFDEKIDHRIDKTLLTTDGEDSKVMELDEVIGQTECDALGILITNDANGCSNSYFGVDIACHKNGLRYGTKGDTYTFRKIIEKCVRNAMSICGYLSSDQAEIIFASPYIKEPLYSALEEGIQELNQIFEDNKVKGFKFKLIANKDFNVDIMEKIINIKKHEPDASESFRRSLELRKLCEKFSEKIPTNVESKETKPKSPEKTSTIDSNPSDYHNWDTEKIMKDKLLPLIKERHFKEEDLKSLTAKGKNLKKDKKKYIPILKNKDKSKDVLEKFIDYSEPIEANDSEYYLCRDYPKINRDKLITWIEKHDKFKKRNA